MVNTSACKPSLTGAARSGRHTASHAALLLLLMYLLLRMALSLQ